MKSFLPLAALCTLSVPAIAQERAPVGPWPVEAAGSACSVEQAFSNADFGSNALEIRYDRARQLVTLVASSATPLALPEGSPIALNIVFLDNGDIKHDDAWMSRAFVSSHEDGSRVLETGFRGRKNVDQILRDLAASRALGLLYEGEVVTAFELAGMAQAIGRLRDCAARAAS